MENYGKPKKTVGMKLYPKTLTILNFLLFIFFMLGLTKEFINNFERIYERNGISSVFFLIGFDLVLLLIALGIPYIMIKLYPKIYYYEDGFTVGKNKEKVLYEKVDYFFIPNQHPALYAMNRFITIWYKNNDNKWKFISAMGYPKKGFDLFQEDFVKINYPKAMKEIENGGTVEFLFNNPKKLIPALGKKKFIEKKLNQTMKIKVSKENIVFDNEVYEWDKYKITTNLGTIVVKDKDDKAILALPSRALIHKVNLLVAIIDKLGNN